ncbi:MAG: hypothetical protein R2800_02680 [Flavipsychrobacter sp.]
MMIMNDYNVGDIVILDTNREQVMRVASVILLLGKRLDPPKVTCEYENQGVWVTKDFYCKDLVLAHQAMMITDKLSREEAITIVSLEDVNRRQMEFEEGKKQLEKVRFEFKSAALGNGFVKEGELSTDNYAYEIYNPHFVIKE